VTRKRSITCALALPLIWTLFCGPQTTLAAASTAFGAQLDAIEKKIEKDELGDEVYAQLDSIISKEPTNYRAHLYLGNCYSKLGLDENAIEEFKLATKYGPNEPKSFTALVKTQIRLGQMPAAMELLSEAQKKFPKDPDVLYLSGKELMAKGRLPEAERIWALAMQKDKKPIGLASSLGEVALMQGDFAKARALAEQDLAIDPKFAMANRIYGLALASTGHFEQSIAPLNKAYEQQPFKPGLAENLAACAVWASKWKIALEPAIISLGASASLDANNPKEKARLYQVFRHVTPKEIERAIESATIKIGKHPPGAYFFALGDVLDGFNMRKLAMDQYRRGLEEEPAYGRGWFRLGQDLEIYAKDYEQALQCYQKAHVYRMQDKEIAMHMYSLSDKLSKRNLDWSWKLKDALRPPKKMPAVIESDKTTASAQSTR
jgi:tetratricopeptide (TPR) repeat protein